MAVAYWTNSLFNNGIAFLVAKADPHLPFLVTEKLVSVSLAPEALPHPPLLSSAWCCPSEVEFDIPPSHFCLYCCLLRVAEKKHSTGSISGPVNCWIPIQNIAAHWSEEAQDVWVPQSSWKWAWFSEQQATGQKNQLWLAPPVIFIWVQLTHSLWLWVAPSVPHPAWICGRQYTWRACHQRPSLQSCVTILQGTA